MLVIWVSLSAHVGYLDVSVFSIIYQISWVLYVDGKFKRDNWLYAYHDYVTNNWL